MIKTSNECGSYGACIFFNNDPSRTVSRQSTVADETEAEVEESEFEVYPNPASNVIHIKSKVKKFTISICDMLGRRILTQLCETGSIDLDTKEFSQWDYIINANLENKVIKKHLNILK